MDYTYTRRFLQFSKKLPNDLNQRTPQVLAPKLPEDIYKTHLEERNQQIVLDSAKSNLASTYVNAFVNAGFGTDKLMSIGEVWLYKNKEHGMMAAAASRCLISLWDGDVLDEVDKYQYSSEDYIKVGGVDRGCSWRNKGGGGGLPLILLIAEHGGYCYGFFFVLRTDLGEEGGGGPRRGLGWAMEDGGMRITT